MRAVYLEPLEVYPGSLRPWKCRCLKCGRTVAPCYTTIKRGGGGCRWCANSGFKSGEDALVYLITHPGYAAVKIGITDAEGSRVNKHRQRGWEVLATVNVPGEAALAIEAEILSWWRVDLGLGPYLGRQEMPQGGWTETVDSMEINVASTIRRIMTLALAGQTKPNSLLQRRVRRVTRSDPRQSPLEEPPVRALRFPRPSIGEPNECLQIRPLLLCQTATGSTKRFIWPRPCNSLGTGTL
jgi:hypothetical protein